MHSEKKKKKVAFCRWLSHLQSIYDGLLAGKRGMKGLHLSDLVAYPTGIRLFCRKKVG